MNHYDEIEFVSVSELSNYLSKNGLFIDHLSSPETGQNIVYLKNYITLNLRKRKKHIRVNTKKDEMLFIEQKTSLNHISNDSDKVHPYSFIIETMSDLIAFTQVAKVIA